MKLATKVVHAGFETKYEYGPGTTAIYQTSTFKLTDAVYSAMRENRARDELIYTRYDNPTLGAVERKLAALEDAEDTLVFSSGMAAISAALETFLKPGSRLVCGEDLYGGTFTLVTERLPKQGVKVDLVPTEDVDAWEQALNVHADVVYCETITNPILKLADVERITRMAHAVGGLMMVDNTFATPINFRPLEMGVDLVIHSGSKYLGGHTDLICGVISGSRDLIEDVWRRRTIGGACLDPHAAYLLERGIKTLAIRVERQNQNAAKIANYLDKHQRVRWVSYPGMPSHQQHKMAERILDGYGGMVAFAVDTDEIGLRFMKQLQVIREATSLGGVESVVSMPMNTSHALWTPQQLRVAGIKPGTLRLSCGIEGVEDLISDLERALNDT